MEEVKKLRILGKNQDAYNLLLPIYDPDNEEMAYEMSIIGYYVGDNDRAREAIDKALFRIWRLRDEMLSNVVWYLQDIEGENITLPEEVIKRNACIKLNREFNEHFTSSTPSIVKTDEGYLIVVRYVNYFIVNGRYTITRDDNTVSTVNAVIRCDKDFNVIDVKDVDDSKRKKYETYIVGLEDIRIAPGGDHNKCLITATVLDYDRYIIRPRMIQCTLEDGIVEDYKLLAIPDVNRVEKNWVPIEGDNRLVYGFKHYTINNYNKCFLVLVTPHEDEFITEIVLQPHGFNADFLRGSTPLIKYENGYLAVFHDVTHKNNDRFYLNRLVKFNDKLEATHISRCFKLTRHRISFVIGLCLHHDNKHVILGYSIMDRTTNFLKISNTEINRLLLNIDNVV